MNKILTLMLLLCISVCAGAADFAVKKNGEVYWLKDGEKLAAGTQLATKFGLTLGNIVHNGSTLTLTNVEATFDEIRVSGEAETYIELIGRTTLTTSGTAITIGRNNEGSTTNVTITGKGKNSSLTIKGASGTGNATGIDQSNRGILTIANTDLTIDVPMMAIAHGNGPLVFRNTNTRLINSTHKLFTVYSQQISLSGCQLQGKTIIWDGAFQEPVDGILTQSRNNIVIDEDKYDVKVAGTYISARNKNDVLYDGTGSVSYDVDTKTLTLKDANIQHSGTAIEADTKLTIVSSGTNYVTSTSGRGIVTYANLVFKSTDNGHITVHAFHEPLVHNTSKKLPGPLSFRDCNVALVSENNDVFISYGKPAFSGCWSTTPQGFTYNTSTKTLNHFGESVRQFIVETGDQNKGFEFKPGAFKAESVTDGSVTLTWQAESNTYDNVMYEVYQNGQKIADNLFEASYTVSGLNPGTKYNFQILGRCNKLLRSEPITVTTLPQMAFDLWIAGTQVTSANCDNIPFNGTGRMSYDPSAKTLTLDGVTCSQTLTSSLPFIRCDVPSLLINANGENKITLNCASQLFVPAILASGDLEIGGSGYLKSSLTFADATSSKGISAINAYGNLTVRSVYVKTPTMIGSYQNDLTVHNARLRARIANFGHCNLVDEYIKSPTGLQWSDSDYAFVQSSTLTTYGGIIDIMPVPLYVGGVAVTPDNAADIKSQYIQWGNVSFDFNSNTLTLDGTTINSAPMPGGAMSAGLYILTDVNINVKNNSAINQSVGNSYGLVAFGSDVTITGKSLVFYDYHSRAIVLSDMKKGCKFTLKYANVIVRSCDDTDHDGLLVETDYSEVICDNSELMVLGSYGDDPARQVYYGPEIKLENCTFWKSQWRPGFHIQPRTDKGDMDMDGFITVTDLKLYIDAFKSATSYDPALDINSDGVLNKEDVDKLAESIVE